MRMLLPALYREGAKLCGDAELEMLQKTAEEILRRYGAFQHCIVRQNAFLQKLFEPFLQWIDH